MITGNKKKILFTYVEKTYLEVTLPGQLLTKTLIIYMKMISIYPQFLYSLKIYYLKKILKFH